MPDDPSDNKPVKKSKKVKSEELTFKVDGFLLPKNYRKQSFYRNSPIFRGSLLLFIICLLAAADMGYQYYNMREVKQIALDTQRSEESEQTRVQAQAVTLRATGDKYRELSELRKQLRVPLSPVLDAIEKTIPENMSVNKINATCAPVSSTSEMKRKILLTLETYYPDEVSPNDRIYVDWPATLGDRLKDSGLKITKFEWGPQRRYIPSVELEKKTKNKDVLYGQTKELALTIEMMSE
jgi:hypothetical protein